MEQSKTINIGKETLFFLSAVDIPDIGFICLDLVYNALDVNADWMKITCQNFGKNYQANENSKIIIQDNGDGIHPDFLNRWLVPGQSTKPQVKSESGEISKSNVVQINRKGRRVIGGLGAGRFCLLALGRNIKITTSIKGDENQYILKYDFSAYEYDYMMAGEGFLNESIEAVLEIHNNKSGIAESGTTIEISSVKDSWSAWGLYKVLAGLIRKQTRFKMEGAEDFEFYFYKDDKCVKKILYTHKSKLWLWLLTIKNYIFSLKVLLPNKA